MQEQYFVVIIVRTNHEEKLSKCVEKSYRGRKRASRESFLRPRPRNAPEMPFFYQGNFFSHEDFFPNRFVRTIMTTDCFFAHLATFRMTKAIQNQCLKFGKKRSLKNLEILKNESQASLEKKIFQASFTGKIFFPVKPMTHFSKFRVFQ